MLLSRRSDVPPIAWTRTELEPVVVVVHVGVHVFHFSLDACVPFNYLSLCTLRDIQLTFEDLFGPEGREMGLVGPVVGRQDAPGLA